MKPTASPLAAAATPFASLALALLLAACGSDPAPSLDDGRAPAPGQASPGSAPGTTPPGGDAGSAPGADASPPAPTVDSGSHSTPDAGRIRGYLHTSGGTIVDEGNAVVRLTGVSWFGLETANYAPHGLWSRSMASMLDQMKSLGFNSIRIPYSNQLFDAGSTPNSIDATQNPDLVGVTGMQLLDKLVAAARTRGMKVILDRHRPDSGGQSELWYTGQYSEQRWISDWTMLATHFKGDSTVVGVDLHNEPHGRATWGDGNMQTDWRLAAERAGAAIQAVNPDLLIIVEGVEKVGADTYWWGGNLSNAGTSPVRLPVDHHLVYSAHDYPASVYAQKWFSDPSYPANLPQVWDSHWGYLAKQGTAPVWIGEFGTKDLTTVDQQWLRAMGEYIKAGSMSFAFWCWNADSGDTGGVLQDDWKTVNTDKMTVLAPLLAPIVP